MDKLPSSIDVEISYLNEAVQSMTTSYKIFCFKAIYDEIILDNYTIDFKTLTCRMIENVWYPLLKYKLSFGKLDQLQKIVNQLCESGKVTEKTEPSKLLDELKANVDDKVVDDLLVKYVIYRLIRPTFQNDIKGIKGDYDQQNKIMELCETNFESIYRVDKEKRVIHVNNQWFKYIRRNQNIVDGWLRFKLIEFLQKRNPNVPSIINKLEPEGKRDLKAATAIWKEAVKTMEIRDIYTDQIIDGKDFEVKSFISIDHFIPWSFIGHDMLWNLIPTNKNVNSSKNDRLPNWNKYFNRFLEQQYVLFCFLRANKKYKTLLEDYLEILKEYDINSITVKESISFDEFSNGLVTCIQPLYQIAFNQGFRIWELEESLLYKQIEEGKEEKVN